MKKLNNCLIVLLFVILNVYLYGQGTYMNSPFWLSDRQIEEYVQNTLNGSCDYCCELTEYYGLYMQDLILENYWRQMGAENGEVFCQYNYQSYLKTIKKSDRYLFFLNKAFEQKFQQAVNYIDREKIIYMCPKDFEYEDEISEKNLHQYIKGAELGNGLAALKVSNFYKETQPFIEYEHITAITDTLNYIFWLRIGAQNGNQECIKEYYSLLVSSKNKNDNMRANFWKSKMNQ